MPISEFSFIPQWFTFVTLAVTISGCDHPKMANSPDPPTPERSSTATIPVFRKLSNQSGREIEFNIVGRTNSDIYTIRVSDNLRSRVPISSLSQKDQMFALSLPIAPPPSSFMDSREHPRTLKSGSNETYITNREKEIESLEQLNKALLEELRNTTNQIESRSKKSEIQRNTLQIEKLRSQMDDFRSRK